MNDPIQSLLDEFDALKSGAMEATYRLIHLKLSSYVDKRNGVHKLLMIVFCQSSEKSDVTKITSFDFITHRLPFAQINPGSEFGLSRFVDQNSDGLNLLIQKFSRIVPIENKSAFPPIVEVKLKNFNENGISSCYGITEPVYIDGFHIPESQSIETKCGRCTGPFAAYEDNCSLCYFKNRCPTFNVLINISNGSDGIGKAWATSETIRDILKLSEEEWLNILVKQAKLKHELIVGAINEKNSNTLTSYRFLFSFNNRRDYSGIPILSLETILPVDLGSEITGESIQPRKEKKDSKVNGKGKRHRDA